MTGSRLGIDAEVGRRLRSYRTRGRTCLSDIENAGQRAAVESLAGERRSSDRLQGQARNRAYAYSFFMPPALAAVAVETRAFDKAAKWITNLDGYAAGSLPAAGREALRAVPAPELRPITAGQRPLTIDDVVGPFREALTGRLQILDGLLGLSEPADSVAAGDRDASGGWNHLRGLGIIHDSVLDGYLATMRSRRTRAQRSAAIGASKELLEAVLKGVVLRDDPDADTSGDLLDLWKKVIARLVVDPAADRSLGSKDGGIAQLTRGLSGIVNGLSNVRNRVGSGHGRPEHAAGLAESHVLLSIDSVYALTRFVAQRHRELRRQ
jgi:Abortive infection C-terminus